MRVVDVPTLVLVLIAGLHLGILGFFGVDLATKVLGEHTSLAYEIVGISAAWQLLRQRFT
jgi:uncharacterized membrane protein YuzA (DUF378 family)